MVTYDVITPNAGQSPGIFPAQANSNFQVLLDTINRDHIFNATPAAGDNSGTHNQVTLTNRIDPTTLPTGTNGIIYLNNGLPRYYSGSYVFQLAPVSARITWNSSAAVQGTPFNATVAAVVGQPGQFDITFTVPIPSIYPQFSLECIEPSTNPVIGKVLTPSISAGTMTGMRVRFVNQNGTTITNATANSLIVFGG